MTEISYFHNGAMRGDGVYAPYSAEKFQEVWNAVITGNRQNGVISNTFNALAVTAAGVDMEVDINSGSAYVAGVYFNSSAVEAIEIDTGGPRIDRIVVRVDWTAQTARLAVVKGNIGTPHPALPDLQQDFGEIYEFPLARVYIAASAAVILYYDIVDERQFIQTAQSHPINNFMHNSEFLYGAHDPDIPPAYWVVTGTPTLDTNIDTTRPDYVQRGNIIEANMAGGEKIETTLYIDNTSSILYNTDYITIAFYLFVQSGGTNVNVNGVLLTVARPTAKPQLFLYRLAVGGPSTNTINLEFEEGTVQIYPITATFGFNPAPFTMNREIVLHHYPMYGTQFNRASATATITPTTLFGNTTDHGLGNYTRQQTALILNMGAWDAGSAGVNPLYTEIGTNHIRVEVGQLPNDTRRYIVGILPMMPLGANWLSTAVASGGFDSHSTYDLIGVIT